MSPALAGRFPTTAPPGKPSASIFDNSFLEAKNGWPLSLDDIRGEEGDKVHELSTNYVSGIRVGASLT